MIIETTRRKELRHAARHRKKPLRKDPSVEAANIVQTQLVVLFERARTLTKWKVFLEGNNYSANEIADVALDGKYGWESVQHRIVFSKIQSMFKSLKSNMLNKAKVRLVILTMRKFLVLTCIVGSCKAVGSDGHSLEDSS